MNLLEKIEDTIIYNDRKNIIALTGGGGKTTTLVELGKYFRSKGKKVLLSTTTKMQSPLNYRFDTDYVFTDEKEFFLHEPENGESVLFVQAHIMNPKKVASPREEILHLIPRKYDIVIFEADGARCLPLKIHSDRDPVITDEVTSVIAIAGMSSFNHLACDFCMGESNSSDVVDTSYLQRLIDDPRGLLKGIRDFHKSMILLNQSELLSDQSIKSLKTLKVPCPVVLGSIKENKLY